MLISADYSQIELRVLAHAAEEPVLKEIFARGEDVHTATASQVFGVAPEEIDPGMRSKAKMINYGIVYGLSDYGLADRLNIPREEAKEFIDAYLERFPRVAEFMAETIEQAKQEGHVKTLWGRRRQIPELHARNYQVRTLGERLAVNTVIQGTAADIIKLAMVRCHARARGVAGLHTRLMLTIHDELLFEGPPAGGRRRARADRARDGRGVGAAEPPLAVDIGVGRELAGGEVSRTLAVLLAAGAGCLVGMQAPVNARLGRGSAACRRRASRSWSGRSRCCSHRRRERRLTGSSGRSRGPLVGARRRPVRRGLCDGRARHRAHARRQRPDRGRDQRPARDLGRDRSLRAARHRQAADRRAAHRRAGAAGVGVVLVVRR